MDQPIQPTDHPCQPADHPSQPGDEPCSTLNPKPADQPGKLDQLISALLTPVLLSLAIVSMLLMRITSEPQQNDAQVSYNQHIVGSTL